jgi:hypothetical protein
MTVMESWNLCRERHSGSKADETSPGWGGTVIGSVGVEGGAQLRSERKICHSGTVVGEREAWSGA